MAQYVKAVAYQHRGVPKEFNAGFLAAEFQNIDRAVPAMVVRRVDEDTTQLVNDAVILSDTTVAPRSVTLLPAMSAPVFGVTIKNIGTGANAVTVVGTVDGVVNPTLASLVWMRVQPDALGNWWQVG